MFVKIGNVILNTDRVNRVRRAGNRTLVYLSAEHDSYGPGGGSHSVSEAFEGPEGEALWEWFCGRAKGYDLTPGRG